MMDKRQAKVDLDADHTVHLLAVLADYHTYVIDQWHCGERENDEVAETCYLLGNIEGRLLCNNLVEEDMSILADWEEELDENQVANRSKSLLFSRIYTCPDCGKEVPGYELLNYGNEEVPYVYPACGCIQEVETVKAQLSYKEEE